MQPLGKLDGQPRLFGAGAAPERRAVEESEWERLVGPVTLTRRPQVLFAEEDLEQARRQLVLYGRDGLPVLTRDGRLRGWLTRADVLRALATKPSSAEEEIEEGAVAAEFAVEDPSAAIHKPSTPLRGYQILELRILADSPARGRRVADIPWPPGCIVVAITQGREIHAARLNLQLHPGERVIVLAPTGEEDEHERPQAAAVTAGAPPGPNGDGPHRATAARSRRAGATRRPPAPPTIHNLW
ncbi:MAG: TrkA C-terminal domain-containing protein [Solirubrobacteraceae bacterium]